MHGVALPNLNHGNGQHKLTLGGRLKALAYSARFFLAVVVVPTLIAAFYYGLIASDQYESSADFVIRRAESSTSSSDMGQLLGFNLGTSATVSEAYLVQEYLLSHDAVAQLSQHNDLVNIFSRSGTDWNSRLWLTRLTPERLLKFYRRHVLIDQDLTSGITHMEVRTFRPADSKIIAQQLLLMGEDRINAINKRTYEDQVATSKRELDEASRQLADVQTRLTAFRRGHEDVDPADTGKAQVTMVSGLTAQLVQARSRLNAMNGVISPASPQYQAMVHQVQALQAQVASQSSKIAGPGQSVATRLSDYEQLVIQREQIAKLYSVAAVQYEQARAEAKRKQLYLVRVVDPNLPVKSEYPKRFEMVLTVFLALFFAYAIGWLLWAGVREHSM